MRVRTVVATVAGVAALALVAGSAALAGGHGPRGEVGACAEGMGAMHGPGMRGLGAPGMPGLGGGLGLPLHRLDVTDEQRAAISAIVEAEQPALEVMRDQLRTARQAFMEGHPPTEFDEAAIRAHAAELAPLLADLAVAEARVRARALAVLTPEQLAKLKEIRSTMHDRMTERRERRRGL
jgi:Spy/CpxP family protein refolding chaperone